MGRLIVSDLRVRVGRSPSWEVVRGVSFGIAPGEALGVVGESGSGKTLTCRSVLRLVPPGVEVSGRIEYEGESLLDLSERQMASVRGAKIGMVFQDPMTALNPLLTVGDSIAQVIQAHGDAGRKEARSQAVDALRRVGIRNAQVRASAYPHQFSGGMRQRVLIGMALAARPTLLLADEPTTALDVIVQAGILRLFKELCSADGMGLLLVSHDFAVVQGVCDRVAVMYAGQVVEEGTSAEVLQGPMHPYTVALIESVPDTRRGRRLQAIPGSPPDPREPSTGCSFAPRCPLVTSECLAEPPELLSVTPSHRARCIHLDRIASIKRSPAVPVRMAKAPADA